MTKQGTRNFAWPNKESGLASYIARYVIQITHHHSHSCDRVLKAMHLLPYYSPIAIKPYSSYVSCSSYKIYSYIAS